MSDGFDERDLRAARPSIDEVARDRARDEIGQRLFGTTGEPHRLGRFVVLDRLGRGGMGVVYSAYDPVLDRRVALKLLRPGPDGDVERMRARLHREAQALARLSHPNVVPVYDVGILEEDVFIVMEFVVGQTLRAWACSRPWHEVVVAYLQAARGLAAAHAVGLVHRDIKPDNGMVGRDGRVRVLDFGLVCDYQPGPDVNIRSAGDGAATAAPTAGRADLTAEVAALAPLPLGDGGDLPTGGGQARMRAGQNQSVRFRSWAEWASSSRPRRRSWARPRTWRRSSYAVPAWARAPISSASAWPCTRHSMRSIPLARNVWPHSWPTRARRAVLPDDAPGILYPAPREPPVPSSIPPAIWPNLRRGLALEPTQRWPSMDMLIDALSAELAAYDRTLSDPRVHRFQRLVFVTLAAIGVISLVSVLYASLRGMAAWFNARSMSAIILGLCVIVVAFLEYARMRWKPAEYLRRLLEVVVVCYGGALFNNGVGLWLGHPHYQTSVSNLVMVAAVFSLASPLDGMAPGHGPCDPRAVPADSRALSRVRHELGLPHPDRSLAGLESPRAAAWRAVAHATAGREQ